MTPDDLEPLSADLKALLDAEKPISAAPAAAKARMLSRLSTELFDAPGGDGGGGSSQGGSGVSSAPAAPSGGVGAGAGASGFVAKAVVTKLVVGASVASLAVGGALGAGVHSVVATPKPVEQSTPAPVVVKEPEKPVEPPPPPPVVDVPVEKVEPKVAPVAPKLSADEQLALEKSYVEQARAAMARQDTTAALEALGQHEKRFPKGQLTEERMALQVMALVSAGRSIEANNLATEFRRRFPNGLMRSVVDGALAQ